MPPRQPIHRLFFLFLLLAASAVALRAQTGGEIKCRLELRDRTLDVRLDLPAGGLGKTGLTIGDWGGQSNFADNVYRLAARDAAGRALKVEKTGARTWTVTNAKKAFQLTYTVVSPKDSFMGEGARNHFHPTLFRDYAFLWGGSFLLFPDDENLAARPARLTVVTNEYGAAHANFPERAAAYRELNELFVAAGDYRVVGKNIGGRAVKFLLRGQNWKFTDEEFAGAVARIMDAQTRYMGFAAAADDLLVTLTEGAPGNSGGTVVKNVISVYPSPQAGLDDFETLRLIAHEHFHFWNGAYWRPATTKKEGYYKWMSEGFTEYYAGLTLFRENLVAEKRFVAWLNELLVEYQTNPHALSATAAVLEEKYWASPEYNRLPYVKGALVAFLTDLQIRQRTGGAKSLDDLMRLLMAKTDRAKGYDDRTLRESFTAVLENDGAELNRRIVFDKQSYFDFMLGARALPVAEVLAGSSIAAALAPHEVFELGFTTETGRLERGALVKEVTSPAAREAGLRAGDELRGMSVRFGRPQEEASFTFQRGAETVSLKYFPKKTVELLQLDENARIPR